MKLRTWIGSFGLALALASTPAQATLYTLNSGTLNAAITDGDANGYQSSQTITSFANSGGNSQITDVNVTLNISGGYNGDLYGYLVGPNGGFAILLNRVGKTSTDPFGYANTGFNVTFDGQDTTYDKDIHLYNAATPSATFAGGRLQGTWNEDGRSADPDDVTDGSTRNALLTSFNTTSASGRWTLFLADVSTGEESMLLSWELAISTVPEPVNVALVIFAGLFGITAWVRRRARG